MLGVDGDGDLGSRTPVEGNAGGVWKNPHSFCKSSILLDIERLYFLLFLEVVGSVLLFVVTGLVVLFASFVVVVFEVLILVITLVFVRLLRLEVIVGSLLSICLL